MHFRLLFSFPLSFVIVGLLLVSASTLFAAGQASAPPARSPLAEQRGGGLASAGFPSGTSGMTDRSGPSVEPIGGDASVVDRCDRLRREIHALSHEITPCDLGPDCHGSPLLCPVALDPRIEREFARLRGSLESDCGVSTEPLDSDWEAGAAFDLADRCALVHDGWEAAARGEAKPPTYTF